MDLLKNGSAGLKTLAEGYCNETQKLSFESIFDRQKIDSFFNNYSRSIENIISASENDYEKDSNAKYLETLDNMMQGHFIPNENLIELSEFVTNKFTSLLKRLTEYQEQMSQLTEKVVESISIFKAFDSQYTDLKTSLLANTDSDHFYKTLYNNYNTEMNFVIKNYFLFFDIVQKAARKVFKATIDADIEAVQKRVAGKIAKIDQKRKEVGEIVTALQDLEREAKQTSDHDSNVFVSLPTVLKDLDKEMRNLILISFQELEVFIHEPLQLLHRSFKALDKLFKEVSEHADIEESFLGVIDEGENTMLDTLKADITIKPLLEKTVDINQKNQLVFTSDFDLQRFFSAYKSVHSQWTRDVGHYLKPESLLKHAYGDKSKESRPQDKMIPAEVEHYLDLLEEDLALVSSYRYEARVNRKNIPHNGLIMMMVDYFVFYSSTVAGTVNLLIPYDSIIDLKSKKNFIGQNNGLNIDLKKGAIEFYLASSSKRDEFSAKLLEFKEVHKQGLSSPIRYQIEPRAFAVLYDQTSKVTSREHLTDDQMEQLTTRIQCCLKKIRVGVFDYNNPICSRRILDCSLYSLVTLWFGIKPYTYDSHPKTNFMYHWREENGCSGMEICSLGQMPGFISLAKPDVDEFLTSPLTSVTTTLFETKDGKKIREKMTLVFTHLDQLAVVVSATGGPGLEYESLLLLRQEGGALATPLSEEQPEASVTVQVWPKRGQRMSQSVTDLYSQRFVEFLAAMGEQRTATSRGEASRFAEMV